MHQRHIPQKDALLEQAPPLMAGFLACLGIIAATSTNNNYAPAASLFSDLGLSGVEVLLGGSLRANMAGFCYEPGPAANQQGEGGVQA